MIPILLEAPSFPVDLAGRLHVLAVHLPIGGILALFGLELVLGGRAEWRRHSFVFAIGCALVTVAAVITGLAEASRQSASGPMIDSHRIAALVTAAASIPAAFAMRLRSRVARLASLALLAALVSSTGHLGGMIVHGEDHFDFRGPSSPDRSGTGDGTVPGHPQEIAGTPASFPAATFDTYCTSCHGPRIQKGDLRLDGEDEFLAWAQASGAHRGGTPPRRYLLERMQLPESDGDHMPPRKKPQPTEADLSAVAAWAREEAVPAHAAAPSETAMAALREARFHVAPEDDGTLLVDARALGTGLGDATASSLLAPVREHVSELVLARTAVTGQTLAAVADAPKLRRLDLSRTRVESLAALGLPPQLETLVLVDVPPSPGLVREIAALKTLRRVYVHGTLDAEAVAELRKQRPGLEVDDGTVVKDEPRETEPEVALGKAVAPVLRPKNSKCPVTGEEADPAFVIVHEGSAIAFCCKDCPKRFWDDPSKFPVR